MDENHSRPEKTHNILLKTFFQSTHVTLTNGQQSDTWVSVPTCTTGSNLFALQRLSTLATSSSAPLLWQSGKPAGQVTNHAQTNLDEEEEEEEKTGKLSDIRNIC